MIKRFRDFELFKSAAAEAGALLEQEEDNPSTYWATLNGKPIGYFCHEDHFAIGRPFGIIGETDMDYLLYIELDEIVEDYETFTENVFETY